MDVVLIHAGRRHPRHLKLSAAQVQAITGRRAIVVGPRQAARYRGRKILRFRATEHLSSMGLGGFWRYAAERLFVLEEWMREAGARHCLHIESDCLLYAAPRDYQPWLQDAYGNGIAVCPLTDDEDAAAVMYVGSLDALSAFNEALLELVVLEPEQLLAEYGGPMANEMRMIHLLRTRLELADALPVTVPDAAARGAAYVFDPGSYGQLVDGTPGEPGVPYLGAHHLIGQQLLSGNYRVIWDVQQRAPLVQSRAEYAEYPLANLHVHSKRLELWCGFR